jgi:hypothetical protein
MANPFRRDEFIPRSEGKGGCGLLALFAIVGALLTAVAGSAFAGHLS